MVVVACVVSAVVVVAIVGVVVGVSGGSDDISVSAGIPGTEAENFAEFGEFRSNFAERFHVQVEKGDAVESVHITVDVPGGRRGQKEVLAE